MKKPIYQIHTELLEPNTFRTKTEWDMFNECVELFQERRFYSSCSLGMVLFEKIFYSRLLIMTYLPDDFIPTKDNLIEQVKYYMERERIIINGTDPDNNRGMSFYDVTKELRSKGIITDGDKKDYDDFYKKYRIPVQHGLTLRLYEDVTGRNVNIINEVDYVNEKIYQEVSELVIRKIYQISKSDEE